MGKKLLKICEESDLKFSPDAQFLIERLDDSSIDMEVFRDWFFKKRFIVGDGDIIAFLHSKK